MVFVYMFILSLHAAENPDLLSSFNDHDLLGESSMSGKSASVSTPVTAVEDDKKL